MSVLHPPKAQDDHDKNASSIEQAGSRDGVLSVKSDAKAEDHSLNVTFTGGIRAPSPNPSLISIDDSNNIRLGRNPDYPPHDHRHASRSPAPPRAWKGKLWASWYKNKGLALVLIAQVFGTLMNVTTRILEREGNNGKGFHPFQILYARMGITVLFSSLYMWYTKTEHFPLGLKEVRSLLIARGLFGFFGVFGMYYSLLYLPLADATVITFLAPSLACWACLYLINEPFTRLEQIAAYISLFGVVLIARPVSLFSAISSSPSNDAAPLASGNVDTILAQNSTMLSHPHGDDDATPAQRAAAVGVAMLGVVGAAGAYTTIRWIGRRAHPLISVNYFATWCTFVSVIMMFALPGVGFLLPTNLKEWCMLIFLGVCGFVMQFLLAAGLQYEKSSRATNMVYTQMLFALGFDKLVFGTTPGALSILGSSLILGSAIYVAMHKGDDKTNIEGRQRGSGEEARGLISPDILAEDDDDAEIQLRTLRV